MLPIFLLLQRRSDKNPSLLLIRSEVKISSSLFACEISSVEVESKFLEAKVGIEKLNKLTLGSKILDCFPHSVLKVKVYLLAVKNVFL